MRVLVTGGCGYIGSILCKLLLKKNINFAVIDNLSNSSKKFLPLNTKFYLGGIENIKILKKIHYEFNPTHIIHLAASIDVNESEINKKKYFINNVMYSKKFLNFFISKGLKNIIFASTAAVYKYDKKIIRETSKKLPENYYGKTKLLVENYLLAMKKKNKLNIKILRFFNVIGCDKSIKIGNTSKKSKHLFNNICYSILYSKQFKIYGMDYDTPDGTCIRDFIDVLDLSKIIYFFINTNNINRNIFNIGINKGYSVLEIINKFQKILKIKINYKLGIKRKGDVPKLVCDNSRLKKYYKNKFINIRTSIINHYKFYKKFNKKNKEVKKFNTIPL